MYRAVLLIVHLAGALCLTIFPSTHLWGLPLDVAPGSSTAVSRSAIIPWQAGDVSIFRYEKPLPEHVKEWHESAISDDLIALNLISLPEHYQDRFPMRELLGWTKLSSSWKIPVLEIRTGWTCRGYDPLTLKRAGHFEIKPLPVFRETASYQKKYERSSSVPRIILPRVSKRVSRLVNHRAGQLSDEFAEDTEFWRTIEQGEQPLILTEGQKKALSLLTAGYVGIGIPGACQGIRIDYNDQGKPRARIVDELLPFLRKKRDITIAFDTDANASIRDTVWSTAWILGNLLSARGHRVTFIVLPDDTKGVDDYLVKYGKERFNELFSARKSPEEFAHLVPLLLPLDRLVESTWCFIPCDGTCGI